MKTASELAIEYWNKPPSDRINTTVQDYVFDYQQKKIDEVLEYMHKYSRDGRISCDAIREILNENP